MQRGVCVVLLPRQRRQHGRAQRPVPVAAQALGEFVQAFEQAGRKQIHAHRLAMGYHKVSALLHHIVPQDAFDPGIKAVVQAHDGGLLQPLPQRQRHRATAHMPPLIFDHKRPMPSVAFFEQINGQPVLEIDLRRLATHTLAKAGAPVVGKALQVQPLGQLRNHLGLAGAGEAAQHHKTALRRGRLQGVDEKTAQGLVAALHAGVVDACLAFQPLLDDLGPQAAPKAIKHALWMGLCKLCPGRNAGLLGGPGHQLVPQGNRRVLPLVLVAGAHLLAFAIVHQRAVEHPGKRALRKLHRRTHIHHGHTVQ